MGVKGDKTRQEILSIAQGLILKKGFGGTSIEEIIKTANITKGGFFYHFDGKSDLAKHLMLSYLAEDKQFFDDLADRAIDLVEDPLQQMLLFIKFMAEEMGELEGVHPGCLVASFTYEAQQFDDEIKALTAEGLLAWRNQFGEHFRRILAEYPMKIESSVDEIADMLTGVIEGGIILSRALDDPRLLVQQLLQYRNYVRLLFNAA